MRAMLLALRPIHPSGNMWACSQGAVYLLPRWRSTRHFMGRPLAIAAARIQHVEAELTARLPRLGRQCPVPARFPGGHWRSKVKGFAPARHTVRSSAERAFAPLHAAPGLRMNYNPLI